MNPYDDKSGRLTLEHLVSIRANIDPVKAHFIEQCIAIDGNDSLSEVEKTIKQLGEVRFNSVINRLSVHERAQILAKLLDQDLVEQSRVARSLCEKIISSCPSLLDLRDTIDAVGKEKILSPRTPNFRPIFSEAVVLSEVATVLQGNNSLRNMFSIQQESSDQILERIQTTLNEVVELFDKSEYQVAAPISINAKLLLDKLNEELRQSYRGEEYRKNLANRWDTIVQVYCATGIGIYDSELYRLTNEELESIKNALKRIPAMVHLFQGVAMRIDFCSAPCDSPEASGSYHMGRIRLHPGMRSLVPGVEIHEFQDPIEQVVLHEYSHACHTYCNEDFKRISGWTYVKDWIVADENTSKPITLRPSEVIAAKTVTVGNFEYYISSYQAPENFEFFFGEDKIVIESDSDPKATFWLYRTDATFCSTYASVDPFEDYSETLMLYLLDPEKLKKLTPEKFEFMDLLYGNNL